MLGLRGDGTPPNDDDVRRIGRIEVHNQMSIRLEARFRVKGLRMVQAAAEGLEGDAHLARGEFGEEDEQQEVGGVEENVRRHRREDRTGPGVEPGECNAEEPEGDERGGIDVDEREDGT